MDGAVREPRFYLPWLKKSFQIKMKYFTVMYLSFFGGNSIEQKHRRGILAGRDDNAISMPHRSLFAVSVRRKAIHRN